jgi:hypothetical protein
VSVAAVAVTAVQWRAPCPHAPDDTDGHHECMEGERRCVWCGYAIEAYPCHGCGKFLTAAEMHSADRDYIHRCRDCK